MVSHMPVPILRLSDGATDTSGSTSNDITLTTSQYNELGDATLLDPVPIPKSPPAEAFDFDYDAHDVKIKLSNARGEEADHPRLFVSNGSVSDGLSIVPVAKVGHIVKYAVVLNISRPTFMTRLPPWRHRKVSVSMVRISLNSLWLI